MYEIRCANCGAPGQSGRCHYCRVLLDPAEPRPAPDVPFELETDVAGWLSSSVPIIGVLMVVVDIVLSLLMGGTFHHDEATARKAAATCHVGNMLRTEDNVLFRAAGTKLTIPPSPC